MPVSALDLVKKLMAKAGVTFDGELTADVPDEVATALDNQLLTIAAATNNHPAVKKVYFAQALNGLDAELNDARTEFGLDDSVWAEIEKAGGSTKRAVALARKIKELSAKAPVDEGKAAQLNAQIIDLNSKLAAEIKKQGELKTEYDGKLKQIQIKQKLESMLSSHKTVYDELPAEAKNAAIEALINKSLQDSDADFTFDEKGNLSLVKKDGTNLFGDNHTLVTPQTFIDKTLSKILKVSGAATNGATIQTTPAASIPGQQNSSNAALKAALSESLTSYNEAAKSVAV